MPADIVGGEMPNVSAIFLPVNPLPSMMKGEALP